MNIYAFDVFFLCSESCAGVPVMICVLFVCGLVLFQHFGNYLNFSWLFAKCLIARMMVKSHISSSCVLWFCHHLDMVVFVLVEPKQSLFLG